MTLKTNIDCKSSLREKKSDLKLAFNFNIFDPINMDGNEQLNSLENFFDSPPPPLKFLLKIVYFLCNNQFFGTPNELTFLIKILNILTSEENNCGNKGKSDLMNPHLYIWMSTFPADRTK